MSMKLYPKGPPRSEPGKPKPPPSKEDLAARKARQAQEGLAAMAEYEQQQRATIERIARLRAERLAHEAELAGKAEPANTKTGNAKTVNGKSGNAESSNAKSSNARSGSARSGSAKSSNARSGSAKSGDAKSGDAA